MVARVTGASLGLLAFTITVASGLFVHNPVETTLSRGILALILFCILGLLLGGAAQQVIAEHRKQHEASIRDRFRGESAGTVDGPKDGDVAGEGEMSGV